MSVSKSLESLPDVAVLCRNVRKEFYLYQHRTTSVQEWCIRTIKRQPIHVAQASFTLKNFDLRVTRGEVVGVVGRNGSGKSTALRLIAGIYLPTAGTVDTYGRVAAVMELGAGFSTELTGAENIGLYGAVVGMSPAQIDAHRGAILDFAEIGEFINTPVKYYSSGMVAKLAFAVAICVKPDILLIDEVLAVGDEAFREKCAQRLQDFCTNGGTMIMVTHNAMMVEQLCSRAIWLENGEIQLDGNVDEVLKRYRASLPATLAKSAMRIRGL